VTRVQTSESYCFWKWIRKMGQFCVLKCFCLISGYSWFLNTAAILVVLNDFSRFLDILADQLFEIWGFHGDEELWRGRITAFHGALLPPSSGWRVTPCSVVGGYQHFRGPCYSTTTLHGVTTQKTSTWDHLFLSDPFHFRFVYSYISQLVSSLQDLRPKSYRHFSSLEIDFIMNLKT